MPNCPEKGKRVLIEEKMTDKYMKINCPILNEKLVLSHSHKGHPHLEVLLKVHANGELLEDIGCPFYEEGQCSSDDKKLKKCIYKEM